MVSEDVEKAVFALVEDYNGISLFTLRRYKLELDTDLNNDFRIDPLDAYELLERYAEGLALIPALSRLPNISRKISMRRTIR